MAHFNFDTMISELTRLDAPLQTGPMFRWQRKFHENQLGIKVPANTDYSGPLSPWKPKSIKTPRKTPVTPGTSKTPNIFTPCKTPGKTGKISSKTPGKTPAKQSQDRFIPSRSNTDVEMGHYAIMTQSENISPSKLQYKQHLDEALSNGQNPQDAKILCLLEKAPKAKEGYMNNLKVLYSSHKTAPKYSTTSTRQIPQRPDRILDAPELLDDYYLSLLDWSSNNHLAVALGGSVYLWNAGNGTIEQLFELQDMDYYISCVSWLREGNILGVGFSTGLVQLWDAGQQKLVRTMTGHPSRVGSLSWNTYILSSGCRTGAIHQHDVRVPEHHVATLSNHTQEVCGLQWSPDGRFLASGGNDNVLNIWDTNLGMDVTPIFTFTQHQAAVKALAWCPWQQSLLASGGGTADRHIRFWNTTTGTPISATDTNSQVCSILWSKEYKELISGHGYSQNQLTIWKYPTMNRVAELTGHTARVLCVTMSPDGTTVASAAADETIRLWTCFMSDKPTRKISTSKITNDASSLSSIMRGSIR